MSAEGARHEDAEGGEVERLRQELAAVRQRLQDEVAYRQAQAESSRQRSETEQLRLHAEELKRRRQAEHALEQHRKELNKAREAYRTLKERYDGLQKDYLEQEQRLSRIADDSAEQSQAAARAAWQSAEEEVDRLEAELEETRQALNQAQERNQHLEQTLASLQGVAEQGGSDEDEQAALRDELMKLRKALELSERGREQANQRAVRLADQLVGLQARTKTESNQPGAASASDSRRTANTGAGNPVAVDLTEANAVLVAAQGGPGGNTREADPAAADLGAELAEEFQIIPADASLERDQLSARQNRVEREAQRHPGDVARHSHAASDSLFTARDVGARAGQPAAAATGTTARGRDRRGRSFPWLTGAVVVVLVVTCAGAGYWFLGDLLPF